MCKGKSRHERWTRKEKEGNVKSKQNSLQHVAAFHLSSYKLMKYSCILTHNWDSLSFSNVSLERVSIKKAVNLVDSYVWGLSYRSEVKTRDAWSILCLKGLCMERHHYKEEEGKKKEMKYCSSLGPQL